MNEYEYASVSGENRDAMTLTADGWESTKAEGEREGTNESDSSISDENSDAGSGGANLDEFISIANSPQRRKDFFRSKVDALNNPEVLRKVKEGYSKVTGHTRGSVEGILKAVMRYEGSPTDASYGGICRLIEIDLNAALDPPDNAELKHLYNTICLKLDVHFSYIIPILSYEPDDEEVRKELSKRGFVVRGRRSNTSVGTINDGLKRDKERLTKLMQSKYHSIVSSIFDSQLSASLDCREGFKTPEQMKALFNFARLVRTPPNTEIVIYYAGHGDMGSGNWLVCDPTIPIEQATLEDMIEVGLEDILDVWISRPEEARSLCLTILADCCFSGHWVQKLKETTKYHIYPICIITACGVDEETPEDNLGEVSLHVRGQPFQVLQRLRLPGTRPFLRDPLAEKQLLASPLLLAGWGWRGGGGMSEAVDPPPPSDVFS
ncbi:hypothetical protein EMCRGX_G002173 [Ephydatia muelleri]